MAVQPSGCSHLLLISVGIPRMLCIHPSLQFRIHTPHAVGAYLVYARPAVKPVFINKRSYPFI